MYVVLLPSAVPHVSISTGIATFLGYQYILYVEYY